MPFLKTISGKNYVIGLWALAENAVDLEEGLELTPEEADKYLAFSNERRKREYLATRHLLCRLTGGNFRLMYRAGGQPFLENFPSHVSISHSTGMVAVILADYRAGIDVEEINRKTDRIDSRFLCERELEWTRASADCRLSRLLCWCAKEAVFKMSEDNLADFARQIEILPFEVSNDCSMEVVIRLDNITRQVFPAFITNGDQVLAWCVSSP